MPSPSIRTRARDSLLALLVSYLRDGTTNTAKFTNVDNVAGTYPHYGDFFTFPFSTTRIFQIAVREPYHSDVPIGITVRFGADEADPSKAMPQKYIVPVQLIIRASHTLVGESDVARLSQTIDECLFRAGGQVQIKNYDVNPAVDSGVSLQWQTTRRGNWKYVNPGTPPSLQILQLDVEMSYVVPKGEW